MIILFLLLRCYNKRLAAREQFIEEEENALLEPQNTPKPATRIILHRSTEL